MVNVSEKKCIFIILIIIRNVHVLYLNIRTRFGDVMVIEAQL